MNVSRPYLVSSILAVLLAAAVWWFLKAGDAHQPSAGQAAATAPVENDTSASAIQAASLTAQNNEAQASPPDSTSAAEVPGSDLDMRTLAICQKAIAAQKFAERQASCDGIPPNDSISLKMCREQQTAMAQEVQKTAAAAASCPAVLGTASAYYEAVKSLAVRGDVAAQRCFIQGYFAGANSAGDDIRLKDDEEKAYPALAKKFIENAFERGDWSVVRWLGRLSLNAGDTMLNQAYPFGLQHLDTAYRMKYLLMLGNQPDSRNDDPRGLTQHWEKERMVSAEQIREGQRWAREMFDQHFNGSQEGSAITEYEFCGRS
jgi:hypothetical protein